MSWLKLITLLGGIVVKLMDYAERKDLMDAGAAKVAKINLRRAMNEIRKADAARSGAKYNHDRLQDDPNNRDE